ncbi:heterokaryon incompatibility protein-domain-containing protein, partial [Leptodontidium sp. MPI-SDFR-AT-0119]
MVPYRYSRLAPGADNIRLLRLMPHENESTERTRLQCELFEYPLQDMRRGTHQYEALSYIWGGEEKLCSILIKGQDLYVTINLHSALLRLRHRSLARILWVDAICIDQEHLEERGQQVRLMAMIYSKAYCVIVWLGGMTDDVKGALECIECAANEDLTQRSNRKMGETVVSNLLKRQWFQRIWVLQEVAAARHVIVAMQKSQQLSYTAFPAFHSLLSLTNLIERAGLRSKHTPTLLQPYSLRISSLAELVDMFRSRQASNPRDKVYALLGMSSDDPGTAVLQPDYNISWEELFQNLVRFILGTGVFVKAIGLKALIRGKGCILGQVSSVTQDDRQFVNVTFSKEILHLGGKINWSFQATAQSIHERDIVCILYGASKPSIIRLRKDHFSIVAIAATPSNDSNALRWPEIFESMTEFSRELSLVWDWEDSQGNLENQEEYKTLTKAFSQARAYSEGDSGDHIQEATKVWNDIMILDDLGEHQNGDDRIREARDSYATAFKKENSPGMLSANARTLLSFVAAEGHEDIVKLLLVTAHPDLKDGKVGQTPLCLAAQNGHEAVVKLLLETGKVGADSKDKNGRTPLSWATQNG